MPCGKTEKAEDGNLGSPEGADSELYKEELPRKVSIGDVWMNLHQSPPERGRQLEAAEGESTLMGRLAARMTSRDMIDELSLGPKGRTPEAKKAQIADNFENTIPSKMMIGPGLHEQTTDVNFGTTDVNFGTTDVNFGTTDKKALNMSDPIPTSKVREGSNMMEQAKNSGNVWDTMHDKQTNEQENLKFKK